MSLGIHYMYICSRGVLLIDGTLQSLTTTKRALYLCSGLILVSLPYIAYQTSLLDTVLSSNLVKEMYNRLAAPLISIV